MMSKAQKLLSGRAISVLLAFSTCLVLLASACGESDSGASGASAVATQAVDGSAYGAGTSPPLSVESPAVSSMSRSDADILNQIEEPSFYGAASPSSEKRIHEAVDGRAYGAGTSPPLSVESPAVSSMSRSDADILNQIEEPSFYGAASPSSEKRIHESDVIVRASLLSTYPGELRFRVAEYLKGTGQSEILVLAETATRNTTWDDREAILFLTPSEGQGASGASGAQGAGPTPEFVFTDAHYQSPGGYTIDTLDPAWLPAEATGNGASGASGAPEFITDSEVAEGRSQPTISMTDLRSKIAWMEGGQGIAGYDRCIDAVIGYKQFFRDWEAYNGRQWTPLQATEDLPSGAKQGTVIHAYDRSGAPEYDRSWLTGQDAGLFTSEIVDEDKSALDGYNNVVAVARPLPSGIYRFADHVHGHKFFPCDFVPENRLLWSITVVAPTDAIHEAFFDPVTIGNAVGADAASGMLKPKSFPVTEGVNTPTIKKVAWEAGRAVVEFEPSIPLAGHHVDFIALDGSLSLRLDFDDASESIEGIKRILAWDVCEQPWVNGDLLMLRISESQGELTGVTNDGPCPVS